MGELMPVLDELVAGERKTGEPPRHDHNHGSLTVFTSYLVFVNLCVMMDYNPNQT